MPRTFAAIVVLLLALAAAGPAHAAAPCDHPASAYSSGGGPGSGAANDPLFEEQWGLSQVGAPAAWARSTGSGATVAIVDTGVDFTHPDLQGKLLPGEDFVRAGAAGDCPGAQDEEGHGTHVAGIAAALTNNGIGVAGTAPDAPVLPVRVLDAEGFGNEQWIVDGIKYAADQGAKVINLSLGDAPVFGQLPNSAFEEAVGYAWQRGAVVVGAAGNESVPACGYPAAARLAVCVAATDRRGAPTFYSNFPADPDGTVALRAPGGSGALSPVLCELSEDIWSTIWPASSADCTQSEGGLSGYDTLAGTSMSAPYVSGVAALLAARGLTNEQIVECLRTKSSNRGSYDPVMGWGIVDADAATRECSPEATPAFTPPAGASGGGGDAGPGAGGQEDAGQGAPVIRVRVMRTKRRRLVRTGRLRVRVSSSAPVRVKLRAVMRRRGSRRKLTAGRKTVALRRAGTRRAAIKLKRRARRLLRRKRVRTLKVRWRGAGQRGVATRGR